MTWLVSIFFWFIVFSFGVWFCTNFDFTPVSTFDFFLIACTLFNLANGILPFLLTCWAQKSRMPKLLGKVRKYPLVLFGTFLGGDWPYTIACKVWTKKLIFIERLLLMIFGWHGWPFFSCANVTVKMYRSHMIYFMLWWQIDSG